jgi:hypothetical protein
MCCPLAVTCGELRWDLVDRNRDDLFSGRSRIAPARTYSGFRVPLASVVRVHHLQGDAAMGRFGGRPPRPVGSGAIRPRRR